MDMASKPITKLRILKIFLPPFKGEAAKKAINGSVAPHARRMPKSLGEIGVAIQIPSLEKPFYG